ncbi:hypothetical protein ABW20_dc0100354 [Dactylellina cionopaga]|nr:hypothetical protein ABW20_dc0100354 [Dactylellina cionopaga]
MGYTDFSTREIEPKLQARAPAKRRTLRGICSRVKRSAKAKRNIGFKLTELEETVTALKQAEGPLPDLETLTRRLNAVPFRFGYTPVPIFVHHASNGNCFMFIYDSSTDILISLCYKSLPDRFSKEFPEVKNFGENMEVPLREIIDRLSALQDELWTDDDESLCEWEGLSRLDARGGYEVWVDAFGEYVKQAEGEAFTVGDTDDIEGWWLKVNKNSGWMEENLPWGLALLDTARDSHWQISANEYHSTNTPIEDDAHSYRCNRLLGLRYQPGFNDTIRAFKRLAEDILDGTAVAIDGIESEGFSHHFCGGRDNIKVSISGVDLTMQRSEISGLIQLLYIQLQRESVVKMGFEDELGRWSEEPTTGIMQGISCDWIGSWDISSPSSPMPGTILLWAGPYTPSSNFTTDWKWVIKLSPEPCHRFTVECTARKESKGTSNGVRLEDIRETQERVYNGTLNGTIAQGFVEQDRSDLKDHSDDGIPTSGVCRQYSCDASNNVKISICRDELTDRSTPIDYLPPRSEIVERIETLALAIQNRLSGDKNEVLKSCNLVDERNKNYALVNSKKPVYSGKVRLLDVYRDLVGLKKDTTPGLTWWLWVHRGNCTD